ncbi:MAG: amidohydrolase family protein [Acidobacteriota bacterium]
MANVNRSRGWSSWPGTGGRQGCLRSQARRIRFSGFATLALIAIAGLVMLTHTPVARLDAPAVYAIKDAQIVTGTGKTIAKGTVVFRDGLITDVGESVKIPADARVIDGAGMTVYPGLIDGYTSLGLATPAAAAPAAGGGRQAALAAATAGQQPDPELAHGDPSLSAADQVKPGGTGMEDARAAGVTTAVTSPRQGIFAGQSAVINLAGDVSSKLILRAPLALTVQFSGSAGFFGQYPNSLMGTVAFIRQTFYDAIRYRDEVDRYSRVKRGVERPAYNKKLAALQPALRGEMQVLFVANSDGDIRRALSIADEFKLKPIIEGALYGYRVADMLKARNVPVILSVDFPKRAADLPDDEDEPLRVLRARAEVPKGAAQLARAGVKFAFTSGTLRPQDFIANVQKTVENGLSKDDALRALTMNAAEILGTSDQLGSVEVGKIANLVVTSGDLLAKDTKVKHVFIDGAEIELKKPDAAPARGGAPGGRPGGVDASGEWTINIETPGGAQTVRMTLRKDGDMVAGTLVSPMGNVELSNGRVDGNQVRLTGTADMGGQSVQMTITGTIEGDTMRGAVILGAMGTFDFTGSRPPRGGQNEN